MRTTISINDDLMTYLKKKAFETGKTLKEVINATLRAGIKEGGKTVKKYSCPEFSMGASARYDLDRALDLAEALENEEILRKIRLKK